MKQIFYILLLNFFCLSLQAEGTKEVSPVEANLTGLAVIPSISSGSYLNCPEDNRIYFRINDFNTERFYFGVRPHNYQAVAGKPNTAFCADSIFVRIYNPSGSVIFQQKLDTTVGSAGFINTFAQAVAGPNIGGLTPTGYNPITITPTVNGAYWIEFYYSVDNGATMVAPSNNLSWLKMPYFDFTVATAANVKYPGRVYSDKWNFVAISNAAGLTGTYNFGTRFAPSASASSEAVLYSYTTDSVVLRTEFDPGFRPIAYNFAVNSYGVANSGNWLVDRRSINSASSPSLANGYKNFLNDPDISLYPNGVVPGAATFPEPTVKGCPPTGPYKLRYKIPSPADVVILLDINGVAGYQPATSDRIIEQPTRPSGLNTYTWDGLDGTGAAVPAGATINFSVSVYFQKGKASIPLYDAEVNSAGFRISGIRPVATSALRMFWDDSQLVNVGACAGTAAATLASNNVTGTGLNNSLFGTAAPSHAWNGTGNVPNVLPAPNATYCGSTTANDANTNTYQWDDFGNVRVINTWAYGIESYITKPIKLLCITVSGTVYNDVDGSANNTFTNIQNGGETGTNGGTLYAAVVDPETNEVIAFATVNGDGTYTINGIPVNSTGLKVIITTTLPVVDNPAPVESVPSGWEQTSPALNTFNTVETNLTGFNFGINRLPESAVNEQTNLNNPGSTDNVTVPTSAFVNSNVGANPNTLDYNGGTVNNIRITSFPNNVTSIRIGNVTYYPNAGAIPGTCPTATCLAWPVGGVTVPFTSGVGPNETISIDPVDGFVNVVIPFVAIDNAGKEDPTPGSVTMNFSTILSNKFVNFIVNKNNNTTHIDFTNNYATNGSKFIIERSTDGIQFVEIGVINGNAAINYSYMDLNPIKGLKNYYRIKQVTLANETFYSQVKFIAYLNEIKVFIYPNPVNSKLNININARTMSTKYQARFYNANGNLVLQKTLVSNNDQIDVNNLSEGIYMLKITNGDALISNSKVIVSK
jgi:hypothetical protein